MTYTKPLLVLVLLAILANEGQMSDWLPDLNQNLNSLNNQIHQMVRNIQENVNNQVQEAVDHVNEVTSKVNEDIKKAIEDGNFTTINSGNGGTIVMNSPGTSRSITSGTLPDGKPFWYDIEDKVIGTNLFHTERYYNESSQGIQVLAYTLNLSDPNAKPVLIQGNP